MTPWGINHIGHMIAPPDVQTSKDGKVWFRAVPVPYRKNWRETIRAAWWVLTGKAEAVVWPDAGELEQAIHGSPRLGTSFPGNETFDDEPGRA